MLNRNLARAFNNYHWHISNWWEYTSNELKFKFKFVGQPVTSIGQKQQRECVSHPFKAHEGLQYRIMIKKIWIVSLHFYFRWTRANNNHLFSCLQSQQDIIWILQLLKGDINQSICKIYYRNPYSPMGEPCDTISIKGANIIKCYLQSQYSSIDDYFGIFSHEVHWILC